VLYNYAKENRGDKKEEEKKAAMIKEKVQPIEKRQLNQRSKKIEVLEKNIIQR
jgi:hypothetical protein